MQKSNCTTAFFNVMHISLHLLFQPSFTLYHCKNGRGKSQGNREVLTIVVTCIFQCAIMTTLLLVYCSQIDQTNGDLSRRFALNCPQLVLSRTVWHHALIGQHVLKEVFSHSHFQEWMFLGKTSSLLLSAWMLMSTDRQQLTPTIPTEPSIASITNPNPNHNPSP